MLSQEDDDGTSNNTPILSQGSGHGFCLCHSHSNSDTSNNDNNRGELDNRHRIIIEILKQLIENEEGL